MDWVIFWMFFTDFRRIEMCFKVAMPRACCCTTFWAAAEFTSGTTDPTRCIILPIRSANKMRAMNKSYKLSPNLNHVLFLWFIQVIGWF